VLEDLSAEAHRDAGTSYQYLLDGPLHAMYNKLPVTYTLRYSRVGKL
jgi:hypothetical protein